MNSFSCSSRFTWPNAIENVSISKKGGARVGAGRPSAGGRRHEIYLGTGVEAKQARDGLEDVRRSLNHRYLRETIVYLMNEWR